ncbi:hypothetical protein BDR04DRAFT_1143009, partial [Suillus decipiens]
MFFLRCVVTKEQKEQSRVLGALFCNAARMFKPNVRVLAQRIWRGGQWTISLNLQRDTRVINQWREPLGSTTSLFLLLFAFKKIKWATKITSLSSLQKLTIEELLDEDTRYDIPVHLCLTSSHCLDFIPFACYCSGLFPSALLLCLTAHNILICIVFILLLFSTPLLWIPRLHVAWNRTATDDYNNDALQFNFSVRYEEAYTLTQSTAHTLLYLMGSARLVHHSVHSQNGTNNIGGSQL